MVRPRLRAGELFRVTGAAFSLTSLLLGASCSSPASSESSDQAGQGGATTGTAGEGSHAAGSHAGRAMDGTGGSGMTGTAGMEVAGADAGGSAGGAQAGAAGTAGGNEAGATAGAGGTAGGGASGGPGAGGDDGTAGGSCSPATTYGNGSTTVTFSSSVMAIVQDESGAPVSGQPIYICGLNICTNPETTAADGSFTISTKLAMKQPALRFGDAVAYAEYAIPLSMDVTDFKALGQPLVTGKLSSLAGAVLAPGTSATSGDVTLTVAAGGAITIDPLVYDTADKKRFRAVKMPVAQMAAELNSAAVTGGAASFALAYGVSPGETIFCPAVKLSVALPHETATANNDLGWAPGTAVEFWVTSSSTQQSFSPYAGWAKMSDGVVSSDGHSVTTKDGAHQGFLALESFAIRKAD